MWPQFRHYVGNHRIALSFASGALFFVFACPTAWSIGLGLPLVVAGEALRVWSSGTLEKNVTIAKGGPYAYTRNPLYVGNFVIGLGFVVMGHNPWLGLAYLLLFPLIYLPTVLEEERFLRAKFGTAYERYLERVPRFVPRWGPGTDAVGHFRWGLVMFHREHRTWYGLAAAVAAVVARSVVSA
jgi:protein-S-isoprenylcysteine O-methyltransferase Ste14